MSQNERLPYPFDLHYDIKHMWEIEAIAKGKPHSSDATPEELVELFIELEQLKKDAIPLLQLGVSPI